MARKWAIGAIAFVALILAWGSWRLDVSQSFKEKLSVAVSEELRVGAPQNDIEAFLQRHVSRFGWNGIASRYEGVIDEVEPFHSITIRVFVDKDRRFLSSEIRDAFTAP